ncbi:MAG: hypothetical protein GWO04_37380, partial [Actinobacteria bacterium]|nr:hypothetical protein [Actinomycetota bacterium]NIW29662.1 hypothetical protein [Actinomycetota bacterium]
GRATLDTWRRQGVPGVLWVLGEETRCPEGKCRTNAAEGPVAPGQEFPSGDALPQVHDGCTCVLAPATAGA